MTENVDRGELAAILQRLSSADDAEVLSAARTAHATIAAAGVSWTALLDPQRVGPEAANDDADWDEAGAADTAEDDGSDWQDETGDDMTDGTSQPAGTGAADSSAGTAKNDTDMLRLIDRLLTQEKDDPEFCAEMEGYKQDIAAGEFDDRDRSYIRDLHDRLRRA